MDHTSFFAGGFLALWAQAGGTFTGNVNVSAVPVAARRIAVHESLPLPELLKNMNKVSNNTMARNIYLTVGAVAFKPPATEEGADKIVARWLRRNHIEATGLVVDNGSGLSRDARISTETMGEILQSAFHSPVAQPLIDSFPTVGVDGTMRHRLMRTGITGHAQIKTGTLGDVRAIAGYVFAKNGHPYLVVSDINDPRSFAGGEAHDALLEWVYNQPDTPDAPVILDGTANPSAGQAPGPGTVQLLPPRTERVTGSFPMRGR
jgi:D-alanyl-D-alanine carboxypeptidase/D-alanyl-D-alanine-endopeptidase (penicillin-binding protein 4)